VQFVGAREAEHIGAAGEDRVVESLPRCQVSTAESSALQGKPNMTAKVTSKGRVTLPKAVRDLLGIGPGSVIVSAKDFKLALDAFQ
jgi:AbrB family looped-hinge helix DNA binding protein